MKGKRWDTGASGLRIVATDAEGRYGPSSSSSVCSPESSLAEDSHNGGFPLEERNDDFFDPRKPSRLRASFRNSAHSAGLFVVN
ncbi:hypothetical protein MLD38_019715 [Melastoma candidum]|uniref:Uncharacterized protein n=1 Tax=Melastoma candidum TaxID=119954 RepID=A0ACB9QXD8_9MYRT|nr:hypothetical protein MLD38_019715 [Melastoma candidum]